ncbi:MBL fold metallo-hydrolase [Paenibacillus daejeonensis]|uniref:MBL fold metallo-hydrolase n=1 Tax=Paenibacillus daejeonensis TaxID=135193 RepID=UPI00037B9A07|nr:MBL fold metallo-hydrolase [Paenibacillus daejeonensis]
MHEYDYNLLITGQLSTNKFRYPDEKRDIICSTTLLSGHGLQVLIDPGWRETLLMDALKEAAVEPDDIHIVYVTHLHPDHYRNIRRFPNARWLVPEQELTNWKERVPAVDEDIFEQFVPIEAAEIAPGLQIVQTPGHTLGHTSVLFRQAGSGQRVLIAADAVLAREYYAHGEVHPISENQELAKQTIEEVKRLAPDLIIPGHDEPFAG